MGDYTEKVRTIVESDPMARAEWINEFQDQQATHSVISITSCSFYLFPLMLQLKINKRWADANFSKCRLSKE